ncbi:hypothetical protein RCH21_002745 [Arthrobacter sp. PL16]|uniref:hypothetical protein n=1 Tax=Arthrobacter sp. PL16 TaxID=3071720 RepID=UPI002E0B6F14|nr:hypothetical protein [Arthrobacter sp. PL16]
MTESSSAGHPDGAALPTDHPLGPASPIPPLEKEQGRVGPAGGSAEASGAGSAGQSAAVNNTDVGGHGAGRDDSGDAYGQDPDGHDDGRPETDRREEVLDPAAGTAAHHARSIRDEQGTHSAGTVPAAFNGEGSPEDPANDRHPEDAASEPDTWDSGGAEG